MKKEYLMRISYASDNVLVRGYADTIAYHAEPTTGRKVLCLVRYGGYPEAVQALSDAIYSGGTVTLELPEETIDLSAVQKQYNRSISHDGVYAEATLSLQDDPYEIADEKNEETKKKTAKNHYIFCKPNDKEALFQEIDRKTSAPLIPEFRDYFLSEIVAQGVLQPLTIHTTSAYLEGWRLTCEDDDKNLICVVEEGLACGDISIPKGNGQFPKISTVTEYLQSFSTILGEQIKQRYTPLFDPVTEAVSPAVLAINEHIRQKAGYGLYQAQLAVAEANKRRLDKGKMGIIVAECGSGKTKIGATALVAHQSGKGMTKAFNLVLGPSHMTGKWVRELEETVPNSFSAIVNDSLEIEALYQRYAAGDKTCIAVISKEMARNGYMRRPAVAWSKRKQGFTCPDCGAIVEMLIDEDDDIVGPADQFFFRGETVRNHKCAACGTPLWTAVNPNSPQGCGEWAKIGEYGFVHAQGAASHIPYMKNAKQDEQLRMIMDAPTTFHKPLGAHRSYPLSRYIKRKMKGRIDGLIVDELQDYNNKSAQGNAMGELYQAADKIIAMTGTLINGYSSGMFYLLYRIMPTLMQLDRKQYAEPTAFDGEYGVVQEIRTISAPDYQSNSRTAKAKSRTRQLPGVSPLVYSRFLLEHATFLSLEDFGANLAEYEEIPVPLRLPEEAKSAYKKIETRYKAIMANYRSIAKMVQSAFFNLMTVYPDQPYGHDPIYHPKDGIPLFFPEDVSVDSLLPKQRKTLELVRRKVAQGEKVIIYTNWTRLDTQKQLSELLTAEGYRVSTLHATVAPRKREAWVEKQLEKGIDVLITNPRLVETGLDLIPFTTLIFFDMSFKLFTLRQAARRSWRINQTAPRIEVYLLYYRDTVQHKAIKLMASKLAVAGLIEGNFSEEGLAAMSECADMTSMLARELLLGIKDNVEDVAAAFKNMAMLHPEKPIALPQESVKAEQTSAKTQYERIADVRKSRIKVAEPIHGQMSFLDFAA